MRKSILYGCITAGIMFLMQSALFAANGEENSKTLPSEDKMNSENSGIQRDFPTFTNPVFPNVAADPCIVFFEGKYYAAMSGENGIDLFCSDRIGGLGQSRPIRIFNGEKGTDHACQFWAPEFHRINGIWYCYFTGSPGNINEHRMFVLRCLDAAPDGRWEFAGALTGGDDGWCIDGTVFIHEDRPYMIYAHGSPKGEQLVIRPMLSPVELGSERAVIAEPRPEDKGVLEGAFQLQTKKHNLLIISANQSHTDDYQLTALELVGGNPMDPKCWKRLDKPFMTKSDTEFGPGHCSVFALDDSSFYLAMHVITASGSGWQGRKIWVQKIELDADGYPAAGQHPVRAGSPQPEPGRRSKRPAMK